MLRRLFATLAVILGGIGGSFVAAQPAQAIPLSYYCPASTICAFDDVFGWQWPQTPLPINRDVGDAPRNTCYGTADFGSGEYGNARLVVNNSAYRWYLFHTSGCTGSHLEIPPYTAQQAPTGWEEVHAWFRTSTTS